MDADTSNIIVRRMRVEFEGRDCVLLLGMNVRGADRDVLELSNGSISIIAVLQSNPEAENELLGAATLRCYGAGFLLEDLLPGLATEHGFKDGKESHQTGYNDAGAAVNSISAGAAAAGALIAALSHGLEEGDAEQPNTFRRHNPGSISLSPVSEDDTSLSLHLRCNKVQFSRAGTMDPKPVSLTLLLWRLQNLEQPLIVEPPKPSGDPPSRASSKDATYALDPAPVAEPHQASGVKTRSIVGFSTTGPTVIHRRRAPATTFVGVDETVLSSGESSDDEEPEVRRRDNYLSTAFSARSHSPYVSPLAVPLDPNDNRTAGITITRGGSMIPLLPGATDPNAPVLVRHKSGATSLFKAPSFASPTTRAEPVANIFDPFKREVSRRGALWQHHEGKRQGKGEGGVVIVQPAFSTAKEYYDYYFHGANRVEEDYGPKPGDTSDIPTPKKRSTPRSRAQDLQLWHLLRDADHIFSLTTPANRDETQVTVPSPGAALGLYGRILALRRMKWSLEKHAYCGNAGREPAGKAAVVIPGRSVPTDWLRALAKLMLPPASPILEPRVHRPSVVKRTSRQSSATRERVFGCLGELIDKEERRYQESSPENIRKRIILRGDNRPPPSEQLLRDIAGHRNRDKPAGPPPPPDPAIPLLQALLTSLFFPKGCIASFRSSADEEVSALAGQCLASRVPFKEEKNVGTKEETGGEVEDGKEKGADAAYSICSYMDLMWAVRDADKRYYATNANAERNRLGAAPQNRDYFNIPAGFNFAEESRRDYNRPREPVPVNFTDYKGTIRRRKDIRISKPSPNHAAVLRSAPVPPPPSAKWPDPRRVYATSRMIEASPRWPREGHLPRRSATPRPSSSGRPAHGQDEKIKKMLEELAVDLCHSTNTFVKNYSRSTRSNASFPASAKPTAAKTEGFRAKDISADGALAIAAQLGGSCATCSSDEAPEPAVIVKAIQVPCQPNDKASSSSRRSPSCGPAEPLRQHTSKGASEEGSVLARSESRPLLLQYDYITMNPIGTRAADVDRAVTDPPQHAQGRQRSFSAALPQGYIYKPNNRSFFSYQCAWQKGRGGRGDLSEAFVLEGQPVANAPTITVPQPHYQTTPYKPSKDQRPAAIASLVGLGDH